MNDPNLEPQADSTGEQNTENTTSQSAEKKSFWQRIKGLSRFRIRIELVGKEKPGSDAVLPPDPGPGPEPASPLPGGDFLPAAVPEPGSAEPANSKPKKSRIKKEKKEKTKQIKNKKQPKPKKAKAEKSAPAGEDGGTKQAPSRKKKPLIIAAVILAVLLVGGGGVFAYFRLRPPATAQARLQKAMAYAESGKYENAIDLYTGLINDEELVVEAYLGLADTLLLTEDEPAAVTRLETGYAQTGDTRIAQRLDELSYNWEASGAAPQQPTEAVIEWTDPALEQMIRLALDIPPGQAVTERDVSGVRTLTILGGSHAIINESLAHFNSLESYRVDDERYSERGEIRSISDISHFKNLERLTVAYNRITDISGVAGLESLTMLALYANEIEDISPLSGLTGVRWLYLYNNGIRDISALQNLTGLEVLSLQHNRIEDLSALYGHDRLRELFLGNNAITDIGDLAGLSSLKYLFAEDNRISDISVVAQIPSLSDINFSGNPVTDYTPAGHVQNINKSFVYTPS